MNFFRKKLGTFPVSRILARAYGPSWRPCFVQRHCRFKSTAVAPVSATPRSLESPAIVLRDYQEECIQAVLSYLDQGHKRLGISLATGAGKTVIFTQLIGRISPRNETSDKTLILVHRRELVEQAARHCRLAYPDRTVEIEMGNSMASGAGDIIIASVQTLTRGDRISKFDPSLFKLVLVDEAHHIVARSYLAVLEHFGLNEASQDSPVLVGVSATFSRFDGLKLGAAIDHIVYHKDYIDMIDDKWLSNAVFTTVQSEVNLAKVKKDSFGDFALGSLSKAVNTENANQITVRAWLANAQDRKSTLVFCVDVAHAQQLTETFRGHGIDARYITAKTPKDVRAEQLRAFRDQEYPVLLNCGLFTEGTDIPNIDCVLLARPTRSKNLLIQMIGRGLRLHPGKKDCHVIDMVATLDTGVISTPTLFGLHPDEILKKANVTDIREQAERATEDEPSSSPSPDNSNLPDDEEVKLTFTKYDTIYDLIADFKSEKHIRTLSPNAWVCVGDDRYVLSDASGWLTLEKEENLYANNTTTTPTPTPYLFTVRHVTKFKNPQDKTTHTRPRLIATAPDLETAVRAADTFASNEFEERYISSRQSWRRSFATSAQLEFLNHAKVRKQPIILGDLTKGQAADLITKLKFGGKKRFKAQMADRLGEKDKRRGIEKLMKRVDVKVGPLKA